MARWKIPESVLVVVHTRALDVLLLRRVDAPEFWQSVTGSKETPGEALRDTAAREVLEETGIDCGPSSALCSALLDWDLVNVYPIYPEWRHRYRPGVFFNTEHVFGLQLDTPEPVRLAPREHSAWRWMSWRDAAQACHSPSNAEAILQLPARNGISA